MGKTFEICDICKEEMQALWAIEVGRATFHLYSNLSELYRLRETVDEMILALEEIQKEKAIEAKTRKSKMVKK
jgi:hypothetical protein